MQSIGVHLRCYLSAIAIAIAIAIGRLFLNSILLWLFKHRHETAGAITSAEFADFVINPFTLSWSAWFVCIIKILEDK